MIVRPALIADLPRITDIHNYYLQNTQIPFDVRPFSLQQRVVWFNEHSNYGRHRILVAEGSAGKIARRFPEGGMFTQAGRSL
jgi:L-amino acid N-acyltransferase YncA